MDVVLVVGGVVLIIDGCGFGCRWVWFWLQAGVVLVVVGWGFVIDRCGISCDVMWWAVHSIRCATT